MGFILRAVALLEASMVIFPLSDLGRESTMGLAESRLQMRFRYEFA